jgi:hypothetical protein
MKPFKWHLWGLGWSWGDYSYIGGYERVHGRLWVTPEAKPAWGIAVLCVVLMTAVGCGTFLVEYINHALR